MTLIEKFRKLIKGEFSFDEIVDYYRGNLRYALYYKSFFKHLLIKKHILEQIDYRIKWMNPECYSNGECVMCGCTTTALQMADRSCDKPCYPPMMGPKDWEVFKNGKKISFDELKTGWVQELLTGKPIHFKIKPQNNVLHKI